jgi:ABC-type polar amino acid transport system ATPase subunit
MIEIRNVSKWYGQTQVLEGLQHPRRQGRGGGGLRPVGLGQVHADQMRERPPICLLFDEPTSALDPEMIGEVLDVMVELAREGMTMMVVTHEMGFARKVAKRVVFMDRGEIVEDAPVAQFFDAPASERAKTFLARILHH